ncbi:glycerophosphodiester phosphodiesterase [Carbonactinospora thermoautotrophica]|uniref:Glycerophosphoryl diester phosphodiesterase n=1 Tax=Carbonactinospora thermoautotrophica TaxID=1469144 RepID=A0A132MU81_9ACTN|nr:glycerophosphodiester phosphodiesterase family protein [Carbonactinospora thermoautotrophica]KWX01401.1 Glycerophosphoryl diester phosphodiesterase [Carbonactinospora thermoautotrophica]MCX9192848.1 glycerophosphodiester phosphodiesterase [Carbonactinospora thermoautotrophica]
MFDQKDRAITVVAHRGLTEGSEAEHTLEAYLTALARRVDAVECDLRLTRDGLLVCVHDRHVHLPDGRRRRVSTSTIRDLSQGVGEEPGPSPPGAEPQPGGEVLQFERLLELLADHGWPMQLHVETKHPTRYGGRLERALVDLLTRHGLHQPADRMASKVWLMSFSALALRRIHAWAPRLPTVLLLDRRVPIGWQSGQRGVTGVGPSLTVLRRDPAFVRRAHRRGQRVHVWTVNEPPDIAHVLDLGVDAVITDRPSQVFRVVEEGWRNPRRGQPGRADTDPGTGGPARTYDLGRGVAGERTPPLDSRASW